jgi:hypothetical protein
MLLELSHLPGRTLGACVDDLSSLHVPLAPEKPASDQQSSHAPLSAFFTQKKCLCTTVSVGPRTSAPGLAAASVAAKINPAIMVSPYRVQYCAADAGCMSACATAMKSGARITCAADK